MEHNEGRLDTEIMIQDLKGLAWTLAKSKGQATDSNVWPLMFGCFCFSDCMFSSQIKDKKTIK